MFFLDIRFSTAIISAQRLEMLRRRVFLMEKWICERLQIDLKSIAKLTMDEILQLRDTDITSVGSLNKKKTASFLSFTGLDSKFQQQQPSFLLSSSQSQTIPTVPKSDHLDATHNHTQTQPSNITTTITTTITTINNNNNNIKTTPTKTTKKYKKKRHPIFDWPREWSDRHINRQFTIWISSATLHISYTVNMTLLCLSCISHAFLDFYTYCNPSRTIKSYALCYGYADKDAGESLTNVRNWTRVAAGFLSLWFTWWLYIGFKKRWKICRRYMPLAITQCQFVVFL
jgi:hypothetical protein